MLKVLSFYARLAFYAVRLLLLVRRVRGNELFFMSYCTCRSAGMGFRLIGHEECSWNNLLLLLGALWNLSFLIWFIGIFFARRFNPEHSMLNTAESFQTEFSHRVQKNVLEEMLMTGWWVSCYFFETAVRSLIIVACSMCAWLRSHPEVNTRFIER